MPTYEIRSISTWDARFPLPPGAGTDAVHTNSEYCLAVTCLNSGRGLRGFGIALTLGDGNRLVCEAIEMLARPLQGMPVEDLMAEFGQVSRRLANDPCLRWLGPHKGVVHLALASITNACFDLWAKSRGVPLWKLLLELTPEQLVGVIDLSYLDEVLAERDALEVLRERLAGRSSREQILGSGYPGYDTSVGWMAYDDETVRQLTLRAIDRGFNAFKLKVGSADRDRDVRRGAMLRECCGDAASVMFDANQQWNLPVALAMCEELSRFKPLWIEEPTHPDDIHAHAVLARAIAPVYIAAGEHVPNRVVFKNFMQAGGLHYVQADCTRLAGISEFLAVSLLAAKFGLPIVPHVGDMGQIHQHLVLFNRIALANEVLFLEHIPHLSDQFAFPARVNGGIYETPMEPGISSELKSVPNGSN